MVISPFYAVNLFEIPPDESLLFSQVTSKDTQIAGFAQIDYRITPPVTLTLGGRLSHNVAKFTQAQSGPVASQEFPYASGEQSETPFIPKVGLAYQATRSNLLYFSAAKGYRVGGANQPIPLAPTPGGCDLPAQPPPFSSDSVWSFELGSKNRLFDGRARLDDLSEQLGFDFDASGIDTIGGYVFTQLGRVPEVGTQLETPRLKITVRRVNRRRIEELLLEKTARVDGDSGNVELP